MENTTTTATPTDAEILAGIPLWFQDGNACWDRMAQDERYLGWGYINGRHDLNPVKQQVADDVILQFAEDAGWDDEALFAWANSKLGRWFADLADDGLDVEALFERAMAWKLLQDPREV
jgi:hypothetical protein